MVHKKLALGLLALALATPFAHAESSSQVAARVSTNAVDAASVEALKNMGRYLQTLKRFEVTTELSAENVLDDGQKLQHGAAATVQVQRPNKLKAKMWSARNERELFYDGQKATLYTPALKYYGTADAADTVGGMVKQLEAKYAIEVPVSDLFIWGTPDAPVDTIESAMNAGQDFIGTVLCDHHAFRQGKIDWQIWIATGDKPLPYKVVITDRSDEARPQSVSLLDWNLKPSFKDSIFKFVPPKGAQPIAIRARDAK